MSGVSPSHPLRYSLIRVINLATSTVTRLAGGGSGNGIGTNAGFSNPYGLAVHPNGQTLYVSDTNINRIRKIDIATAAVSTFASRPDVGALIDGVGTNAVIWQPYQMAITRDGSTLYVADYNNYAIRTVNLSTATVTTVAGSNARQAGFDDGFPWRARFAQVSGIALSPDNRTAYIVDQGYHNIRALQLVR